MGTFFFRAFTLQSVLNLALIAFFCYPVHGYIPGGSQLANVASLALLFINAIFGFTFPNIAYGGTEKVPDTAIGALAATLGIVVLTVLAAGVAAAGFGVATVALLLAAAFIALVAMQGLAEKRSGDVKLMTFIWFMLTGVMCCFAVSAWPVGGYLAHLATAPMSEAWRLAVPAALLVVQFVLGMSLDHAKAE